MINASYKLCFVSVVFSFKIVDHGGHQGMTAQALNQWGHPAASSEALNVLHQAMHPTSYHRIQLAIEIASNVPAFFAVNSIVGHNHS
jgi:hypothetical protein